MSNEMFKNASEEELYSVITTLFTDIFKDSSFLKYFYKEIIKP